jgi:DNA-binding XRE family transcriptional regulator
MTRAKKWRKLYENLPAERRRRVDAEANRQLAELPLQELRRARELSQQSLAEALGGAQSTVSKLESQADMYVSTLRRYIEAMGGELEIIARFPDGEVRITQFAG